MAGIGKIVVFDEKKDLTGFAVRLWREAFRESMGRNAPMTAALSGGHTPVDLLRTLAQLREGYQWEKIHLFLVDERFVPPADEDSNYRMVRETLLDNVPIPEQNIHPVKTVGMSPEEAAFEYERELKRHFAVKQGEFPCFDLILLGLGEDGHTASLFPGNPAAAERERWVVAVKPERARHERITLTLPVLNRARCVVFLVAGAGKAKALKGTVEKKDPGLPAARVSPAEGSLLFLVDREAAGLLSEDSYVTSGT